MTKLLIACLLLIGCTFPTEEETDMGRLSDNNELNGWSQSGNLVTGAGVGGSRGAAVQLQAELKRAGNVTTQFNIDVSPSATQGIPNCKAEIVSSVNGNTIRRLIDVIDGASITTRGHSITVRVRDYTVPSLSTGRGYTVSILSTLGIRASIQQPPVLTPLVYSVAPTGPFDQLVVATIAVPAGQSRYVEVPDDAGANAIFVSVANTAGAPIPQNDVMVHHLNRPSLAIQRIYDPRAFEWVPIAPNASLFQLQNVGLSGQTALFAVTFGIDG